MAQGVCDIMTGAPVTVGPLASVGPDDEPDRAAELMREHAVRRIPVVDDGHPVGVISPGDPAVARDPESALAAIGAAKPNR
jgi:CBS domain-containing protein